MSPIIDDLEEREIDDSYGDAYTEIFLPHIRRLEDAAVEAEKAGKVDEAENLYLCVSTLLVLFPRPTTKC